MAKWITLILTFVATAMFITASATPLQPSSIQVYDNGTYKDMVDSLLELPARPQP